MLAGACNNNLVQIEMNEKKEGERNYLRISEGNTADGKEHLGNGNDKILRELPEDVEGAGWHNVVSDPRNVFRQVLFDDESVDTSVVHLQSARS